MRNRLHSICPYFAMFPEEFVREYVGAYTEVGEYVLDPFSGRGTTVLESLILGRNAIAVDINPVAYCISSAKANAPKLTQIKARLTELALTYRKSSMRELTREARELSPFFRRAFYNSTLLEILFLRKVLNWRESKVDRFIAALALGSLHGERDKSPFYFSNQMPRTISTKPDYSLKYWKNNGLWPRKRDVFDILQKRAVFRLTEPTPLAPGSVKLADARRCGGEFQNLKAQVKLVVTSPPYFNVTSYEEDQWLRLWFLGYSAKPTYRAISTDDRHDNKVRYWNFLQEAWSGIAPLLKDDAVFVCRIGAKGITKTALTQGLKKSLLTVFPDAVMLNSPCTSQIKNRQAKAFNPESIGCLYEVDYVFKIGKARVN